MSTIKEMVESLEEDSFLHFRSQTKTDFITQKASFDPNIADDKKQNSFEKIIKYMKKEIGRIDAVKKRDRNPDRVQKMMKEFLVNLKRIELTPSFTDDDKKDKSANVADKDNLSPHIKISKARSQTTMSNKTAATKIKEEYDLENEEIKSRGGNTPSLRPIISPQESSVRDEENIDKDFSEPIPNKLPPVSSIASMNQSPESKNEEQMANHEFYNDKVSDV